MWCDNCDNLSFSVKTTIRITNNGKEVLVKKCNYCGSKVETEIVRKKTTRIYTDNQALSPENTAKNSTKENYL